METVITSYCKIVPNKISVGGKLFFEEASEKELPEFLSAAYKHSELNYPKFHKMDKLCKLGMLAAELAIRNCPDWESQDKSRTALFFQITPRVSTAIAIMPMPFPINRTIFPVLRCLCTPCPILSWAK